MPAAKKKAAKPAAPAKTKKPAAPKQARATSAQAAAPAKPPKSVKAKRADGAGKADKAKKPKLVRDSFTIPKNEYTVLETLKLRAARLGRPAKKSELLRAGVMALAGMGDASFLASVTGVPAVKTGRPAKSAA